jgi:N,N-dimethylformamidase beta subunit-like protein
VIALVPLAAAALAAPTLTGIHVDSGPRGFAGDDRLLATVSPNGDGFRDAAVVAFRLDRPARVRLEVVRTDTIHPGKRRQAVVWRTERRLAPGRRQLVWSPRRSTPPRTYVLRLTATGPGGRRVYDNTSPGRRRRAPVVRVQGVEAGFRLRSYAPGDPAVLTLASDALTLRLQVFHYSSERGADFRTAGTPMTEPLPLDWSPRRNAPATLDFVRAGNWPSGLYFLRAAADDGRVGYAPFIVRPKQFGATSRIAVVLATNTWQAYNFWDRDGDGWGDSWYVSASIRRVDLRRPYLDFGVPFRFRDWDLDFISWLNRTDRRVEFLSDDDLERFANGAALARAYDLIVFPGHEEYVTGRAYDLVERYRDQGGNLLFLAANNFFWRVDREGELLRRVREWRQLRRPEAALVGVQYIGSDYGGRQGGYVVADGAWPFDGTGLAAGSVFGRYGIEIDARTSASPRGTRLLASIPDLMGIGRSAEMTYYETPRGAKVFAAGALNFAASIGDPAVQRLLENVWARLSRP